jgi:hypothetical protein
MSSISANLAHPLAEEVVLKPRFIFHCVALLVLIATVVFA